MLIANSIFPDSGKSNLASAQAGAPVFTDQSLVIVTRQLFQSHVELRSLVGESYLSQAACKVIKNPDEALQQFLADVASTRDKKSVTVSYYFGLTPKTAWRPMQFVTKGMLDDFERAALEFYRKAHAAERIPEFQRKIRVGFRLPDPDLDPDSYWLVGERFNPRLIILWGCEKLDRNNNPVPSLPLVKDDEFFPNRPETIVDKLRKRLITWPDMLEENLALLAARQEALSRFIARPEFDKQQEQAVGMRLILAPNAVVPITRFRPLKRLPSSEVDRFTRAAREFYAKAHEGEGSPEVSSYERELRRSFRLPRVASAPSAVLPKGMEGIGTLLESGKPCKNNDPRHHLSYWTYGKGLKRQLLIAVDGQVPEDQCIPLTTDPVLDLPPGSRDAAPFLRLGGRFDLATDTIDKELSQRQITWVRRVSKTAACVAVLSALVFGFFHYIYVPLGKGKAEVTDDRSLDYSYDRNVILVTFPQAIDSNSIVRPARLIDKVPTFVLENDKGTPVEIKAVQLRPSNNRQVALYLDKSNAVPDSADYKLIVNGLRPRFGRPVGAEDSVITVATLDTHKPEVKRIEAAPDSIRKIKVTFTKPMNADAFTKEHYSIRDFTFERAEKKSPVVAILTAGSDFMISNSYQIAIDGIHDATRNNNPMSKTNIEFVYYDMPPVFDDVSAAFDQMTVRAVFSEEVDPQGATNIANYNLYALPPSFGQAPNPGATATGYDFGTNRLSIYSILLQQPARNAVSISLTNSHLMPKRMYALTFSGVKNGRGNPGSDARIFPFAGTVDTQGPELKDTILAPDYQSINLVFTKPIQGEATRDPRFYQLDQDYVQKTNSTGWQASQTRLIPSQSGPDSVLVKFSPPLADQFRYRLAWSNVQDLIDNAGPAGSLSIVPRPVFIGFQSKILPLFNQKTPTRIGVEARIYFRTKAEAASFEDTNFLVTAGDHPLPGTMHVAYRITKPKDLYISSASLTWDRELPHDTIHVQWRNLTLETQPPATLKLDLPFLTEAVKAQ